MMIHKQILRYGYFFIFISVITLNALAQKGFTNKDKAKNLYENSLKEGKWIEYKDSAWKLTDITRAVYYHLVVYEKDVPVGVGRDYYLNDQMQNEYIYTNGLKNGPSKWYYESGKLKGTGFFKDNELEGKITWYYTNGGIMEEDNYVAGKREGLSVWYYEDGSKETEVSFTNDEKHGIQKWYYKKSGKLYCDVNYTDGKKNGVQKWYHEEKGSVVGETIFENGEKNGKDVTLYNDGKLRSECFYINGKAEGIDKVYFESGKIKREINYVKGDRQGKFITYWENGKIKRDDIYENDKLVSGKTFDENGNEVPYYAFEIMPEFVGGMVELGKFIQKEIVYPTKARKDGVAGRVVVKFVVDVDGSITDVSIVNSISKELDEEALRVVNKMPKWKPALMDGENAKVYYNLPIRFRL